MTNRDKLLSVIKSIIEAKYKEASPKFRIALNDKICSFLDKEIKNGKILTVQIFDKNAKSQKIQYMNREPHFFTILNIDI